MPVVRTHVAFQVDKVSPPVEWQRIAGWIDQHHSGVPAEYRQAASIEGVNVPAFLSIVTSSLGAGEAIREAKAMVDEAVAALKIKAFSWTGITAIPILISTDWIADSQLR